MRAFALAVKSLEALGGDPAAQIVVFRGYNTATLLIKNEPFREAQVAEIQAWAAERAFDMVYTPGLPVEAANQYNILPEPLYYQAFQDLLHSTPRDEFYEKYPFDVAAPRDDRPFFGHYFKWSQSAQILAELGKTWQPFGGAGYFVVLVLLVLAILLATLVILLPVPLARSRRRIQHAKYAPFRKGTVRGPIPFLTYFALIGLGFLLAEIPLIQRFILFLGYPAYALTAVLFSLLLFSGLGSYMSVRLPLNIILGALVLTLFLVPTLLPIIFQWALGAPLWARLGMTVALLAPLGFLMGIAAAGGIRWMMANHGDPLLVPWIWAVNGAASVIARGISGIISVDLRVHLGTLDRRRVLPRLLDHSTVYSPPWIPSPVKGTNRTPPML